MGAQKVASIRKGPNMSEIEVGSTHQSGTLETDAPGLTANEAPPAATDQGSGATLPLQEPPVTEASSPDNPIEGEGKRAISPRKLAANRANAQHSTGPKTADGKAKSAQNSIKHGIFVRQLLQQAPAEFAAEMETFAQEMRDYYQPVGKLEEILVDKIVAEHMRYARILAVDQYEVGRPNAFWWPAVDRVARYATSANRALSRAMEDLERIQNARKARESAAANSATEQRPPAEGRG